ncbi:MAG: ATP-binding protein [Candidatus Aminicenantes bacterium]|nr:ATP-binding protein [Candidatus Aminicenantes bacterium]
MKYRDLVQFEPIESVVQLREADDKQAAEALVKTYVISERMADVLTRLVIPQVQFDAPRDNKGLMVVGNYGTGKSHLMSVLSAVAEHADLVPLLTNDHVAEAAAAIAGKFRVVRTEIGATVMPLRDILFGELALALDEMGVSYSFPPMDEVPNSKDLLVAMMGAFQEQYPDHGLLLIVDELLDYLRSRRDQQLVLDLTFLRELGEACRFSRFRFVAGIQESLFDSPRFQFVADSVRRVKDRFEQVRIAREDVAYVVAERLLHKTPEQRGRIRAHLSQFTPLYGTMAERMDDFVRLFPVHPAYLEVFERVYVAEKREVLKSLSAEMQARLDETVPKDRPGLIAYDAYWTRLRDNASFRSIPEVKEVIDKSQVLEDRVRNAFTRPQYRPAALRIIHALSVHRLTTGDIYAPLGATADELRDSLCLYLEVPEREADFLKTSVESTLREIMRTVSGQFLSFNPENGQYYLDLKKDIDFDALIEQRAESLGASHFDRYYFEVLKQVMECTDATYVPGYSIWEHEVEWRERRVTRPGYLFFGAPNERSTAQPPRDFYLYMLQPYEPPAFTDQQQEDEVFFRLARPDEAFEAALRHYSGAREMATSASGENRLQYEKKATADLRELQKWLRENAPQAMDVTYHGVTRPLVEWIKEGAAPRATSSVRDLINAVASACLTPYFAEAFPGYPAFSILVTQASREQAANEAVRWLSGGLKTRQGTAVLDALDLLDGERVKGRDSHYGGYFLDRLHQKGEGQVLNRSEVIAGPMNAEVDPHFKLEPEWVAVVLLALVYTGEITLAVPGRKIDAGTLEEASKIGVDVLANWKFIERPKGLPLAALTELFQLLGVPSGLIKDANQHGSAVQQLQKQVAEDLDRLVLIRQKAQGGMPLWEDHLLVGAAKASLVGQLDAHKAFLESLQTYNTPGKLRNFRYSAGEVEAQATGRALVGDLEALADVVAAIQPLTSYLGVARAVLPAEHAWSQKVAGIRAEQLAQLRDPQNWRRHTLRSALAGALENLKAEYVEIYLGLHRQARLNAAEDDRKKQLMADPRHGRLTALAGIEFLLVAKLRRWEQEVAALQPCYAVGASEMQDHATCPRCGYRPVEKTRDRAIAAEMDELETRLAELHANWTGALLANLRQEATQANVALMTPGQQKLVKEFLETETLPKKVSYEFVDTVKEALSGLERVAVPPEDILLALTQGGMPCTVQELMGRFRAFVEEKTEGKDANKVRIVVEW